MLMIMIMMMAAAAFLIMFVVVIVAVAFSIVVMVLMLMVVVVTAATLSVMVMLMFVIMVMAMTLSIVVMVLVIMMMFVVVIVAVAFPVMVVMIMVMTVAFNMLIQLVHQTTVIHRMVHPVLELVVVDIQHGAHECEVDLLLGVEVSVLLDSVPQVCEVERDTGSVVKGDRGLDVSQHGSCLGFHPFADLDHGIAQPGLGIGVPAFDPSGYSGGHSSGLFQRCLLSAHSIIS